MVTILAEQITIICHPMRRFSEPVLITSQASYLTGKYNWFINRGMFLNVKINAKEKYERVLLHGCGESTVLVGVGGCRPVFLYHLTVKVWDNQPTPCNYLLGGAASVCSSLNCRIGGRSVPLLVGC